MKLKYIWKIIPENKQFVLVDVELLFVCCFLRKTSTSFAAFHTFSHEKVMKLLHFVTFAHAHRNSGTTASASWVFTFELTQDPKIDCCCCLLRNFHQLLLGLWDISAFYCHEIPKRWIKRNLLRLKENFFFLSLHRPRRLCKQKRRIHHQTEWMAKRSTRRLSCSITVMSRAMSGTRQEENRISSNLIQVEHPQIPIIALAQHREWLISVLKAN